jgi:unspecific monooxygenase
MAAGTAESPSVAERIPGIGLGRNTAVAAFAQDKLGFLLQAARQYGPVVQLWPGVIMVTGSAEVDIVIRRTNKDFLHDRNFMLRKRDYRPGSANLAFWMKSRRAALAGMTPSLLAEHAAWLAERTDAFATKWLRLGLIADVPQHMQELTAASIARFSFGTRHTADIPRAAQAMLDALLPIFASPFEFPAYIRALQPRERRLNHQLRVLHSALRSALHSSGHGGLSEVITGQGLDEEAVIHLLMMLHLAGHGVPAAALSWALVELARNPEQQEAAAAAAARWNGTGPAPDEICWVMQETLRLWPPSWLVDRITDASAECGAWTIPARSKLLLPLWAIHRLADCYQEPERFDSQRWAALSPPPGTYLPYSSGPKWCLGARFADVEMTTILTVLLRRIRVSLRGEVQPDARRTLTPTGFELLVEAHSRS